MKLKRLSNATLDGSEYEGEYEGFKVRIERRTDLDHGGRSYTIWHGFIWDDRAGWAGVAENYRTMESAVHETKRWIRNNPKETTT